MKILFEVFGKKLVFSPAIPTRCQETDSMWYHSQFLKEGCDFNSRLPTTEPAITCSKLTIETLEWRRSGIFIVNFEHIPHLVLVFLLLTLSK